MTNYELLDIYLKYRIEYENIIKKVNWNYDYLSSIDSNFIDMIDPILIMFEEKIKIIKF
jgi:hypothetical protein